MTKKILLVLVLVFSILSIILIAVWGTLPDQPNHIQVESLIIDSYDETNDDGDKFKNVANIVTEQQNIYTIEYVVNPGNANLDIGVSSTSTGVNLQVDMADNKVHVLFSMEAIGAKETITIQIKDKNTQISDEITLWFKTSDVIIVPDI
ncbi:MAG: hypothetical protein WCR28_02590 [Candidatus Izemoplasmatales bacterium]|jgi:hypothetical protein|nr:hypothetical protein [Candidatus Izemoplasmatales bacterium]MDD4987585.1 hypothetical protein [Candidatus Izemoplasmatales bacterium]MDY0373664.1 hypothetical protein [Candidatus Izemoplasmatales bacterium]NLF49069.1 hypothetical protein [Acholeplasmataceae bacterium]